MVEEASDGHIESHSVQTVDAPFFCFFLLIFSENIVFGRMYLCIITTYNNTSDRYIYSEMSWAMKNGSLTKEMMRSQAVYRSHISSFTQKIAQWNILNYSFLFSFFF